MAINFISTYAIAPFMELEIKRSEVNSIGNDWTVVYGRRKVGKTFMLKHFYDWDYYASVTRDGIVWVDGFEIDRFTDLESFTTFALNSLKRGKKVVIDEFQRLPHWCIERISSAHPKGTLVLSGSSIGMAKKILSKKSPLLGLAKELNLDLIDSADMLKSLPMEPMDAMEYGAYLRDPWLIPFMKGSDIHRDLYNVVVAAPNVVPALIMEVFTEEDRKLTATYDAIIREIGSGTQKPSEVASALYCRGIIGKDAASDVVPFIKNLVDFGILKAIRVHSKRNVVYRMGSPIFSVFYYLASKFEPNEETVDFSVAQENVRKIHTLCMEWFVAELLAKKYGGYLRYSYEPEIDGIVVDRKERVLATVEVKWGKLSKSDVSGFLDKVSGMQGDKLIVTKYPTDMAGGEAKILCPEDFLKLITIS